LIKIPKKRSSNLYFLPISFFFILLVSLFIYAFKFNPHFFLILGLSQIIILFFLFRFRQYLVNFQGEIELKQQDCAEKANLLQSGAENERLVLESYRKKIISYSHLKNLTEDLSMCLSQEDTSNTLSEEVNRLFGDEDVTTILYLFHSKTGELGLTASQKGQMQINLKSKKGDVFDEWVVRALQPLIIEDTKTDFRFDAEKINAEEVRVVRSLISVPLMIGNKALGILRVDSPKPNHFITEDLRFLTTVGDLGAVAIENAQLYERVEELAIRDGLTGLYLRRHFLERMAEEVSREFRKKKELSFLMIDLDKFKQYNDQFGHIAGDIVLKTVGMILLETFRDPGNLICRFGGEEFGVLLPDCPKEEAVKLAEDLRKRIAKQEIILRREKTRITVSVGVAAFPTDAQTREDLIQKADRALYKAKSEGRNKVCFD